MKTINGIMFATDHGGIVLRWRDNLIAAFVDEDKAKDLAFLLTEDVINVELLFACETMYAVRID